MSRREELQAILEGILGSENVYFQPPASMEMHYDCIKYAISRIKTDFANNRPYNFYDCYQVIAIYEDPDSNLPKKIAAIPMCSHERHYSADNLYHDVFNLYF